MSRPEFTSTHEQSDYVRAEFDKFAAELAEAPNRELPRTYGFEIETPDADTVRDDVLRVLRQKNAEALDQDPSAQPVRIETVLDFHADGSVESVNGNDEGECECECRDCVYHECNCDNCRDYNDSPSHDCGSDDCYTGSTYQEITSVGGLTDTHPEALAILAAADLAAAEINDSCGLHVHIGSKDLTPAQVGRVITAYRATADLFGYIAGRRGTHYARDNEAHHFAEAIAERSTDKYYAVNTAPHFSRYRPAQTIEFRQHAGTNDVDEVRAWAILLVALVEYAKRNAGVYYLARCRTLAELRRELGV